MVVVLFLIVFCPFCGRRITFVLFPSSIFLDILLISRVHYVLFYLLLFFFGAADTTLFWFFVIISQCFRVIYL